MAVSLAVGALAAAIAGLAVGIPSLRLKGDYLAIVTLGFGEIIRVLILNIPAVGGATGFTARIPITNFFWIFAMAVLTIVIVRNIAASTFGRALATIRGDEIAAEAMGVNTTRYKVLAFVDQRGARRGRRRSVGTAVRESAQPAESQLREVDRSRRHDRPRRDRIDDGRGPRREHSHVLPEALRTFDQQFPGLRMVIYALLLILLMIFRPQGLLGRRSRLGLAALAEADEDSGRPDGRGRHAAAHGTAAGRSALDAGGERHE